MSLVNDYNPTQSCFETDTVASVRGIPIAMSAQEHVVGRRILSAHLLSIVTLCGLILLSLANLYGAVSSTSTRTQNLRIMTVDHDNGTVSAALHNAYGKLQDTSFPTLEPARKALFPTVQELATEVCQNRHIWGGIYVQPGASETLDDAISDSDAMYNSSQSIILVYNSIRYPSATSSDVVSRLTSLLDAMSRSWQANHGLELATHRTNTTRPELSPSSLSILTNPFTNPSIAYIDITPSPQGSKALYNTVTIVATILSQFFFCLAISSLTQCHTLATRLTLTQHFAFRYTASLVYSASMAATLTGVLWSFRDGWAVTAAQGVQTWLVYIWLTQIEFFIFDTVLGLLKMPLYPYFVLSWVLLNVTSVMQPVELMGDWYRWAYALPSFEAYQLLITVWSHGCVPQTFRAVPILAAWWTSGLVGSAVVMARRKRRSVAERTEDGCK
jgi:hypothetical protein